MKLQNLAAAAAALAMSAAIGSPAHAVCKMGMVGELHVTMQGHRAMAPVKVNGVDAKIIVDTGAFWNFITPGYAAKFNLSIRSEPGVVIRGVGGESDRTLVGTAQDFSIAGANYHGVTFVLADKGLDSDSIGLLGENFLSNADVEYDLANGAIRLFKPDGCAKADLSYWVGPQQPYSIIDLDNFYAGNAHIAGTVLINGERVRAIFDTGAPSSMLSTKAAWRAGVKPTDANVVVADGGSGVSQRSYIKTWLAPFASFKVGDEEIKNVKLIIGNMGLDDDMLVGADFFLSHRVLVSNSQHKMYFTYNGGPVFDQSMSAQPPPRQALAPSGLAPPAETMDADAYSRHAAALVVRRDLDGALADLGQAIQLAPKDPRFLYERAKIYRTKGQAGLAMDDLNRSLIVRPDYIPALLARAAYEGRGEPVHARADLDAADKAAQNHPDDRLIVAEGYVRAGLEPEAIVELGQWIDVHPKDDNLAEALNSRCWLRGLRSEALDKALEDCDVALRLQPEDPDILDSRGLVHLRLGDLDKAISDYNGSLRTRPKGAWSLYGRGLAEQKKGDQARADADFAAAKAVSPTIAAEAEKRGLKP
jgi:tetratricopeptide (TPR) repeat protein